MLKFATFSICRFLYPPIVKSKYLQKAIVYCRGILSAVHKESQVYKQVKPDQKPMLFPNTFLNCVIMLC